MKTLQQYEDEVMDVQSVRCGFEGCGSSILVSAANVVHLGQVQQLKDIHWSGVTISQVSRAGACFCANHSWWPRKQGLKLLPMGLTVAFLVRLRQEQDERRAARQEAQARMRGRFTIADTVGNGNARKSRRAG